MRKTGKRRGIARRIVPAILIAAGAALLAGCATTEPIWFIATPGYVDSRIARSEEETRQQYEQEIASLEQEVDEQRTAARELAALADVIAELESSNRELLGLADDLEVRLANLPDETIRQLVTILEDYLAEDPAE